MPNSAEIRQDWTHDPDHALLQAEVAAKLLHRLGVLTEKERERISGRAFDRYKLAPKGVSP
jgi:hypothetical protein